MLTTLLKVHTNNNSNNENDVTTCQTIHNKTAVRLTAEF